MGEPNADKPAEGQLEQKEHTTQKILTNTNSIISTTNNQLSKNPDTHVPAEGPMEQKTRTAQMPNGIDSTNASRGEAEVSKGSGINIPSEGQVTREDIQNSTEDVVHTNTLAPEVIV